jgi:NADPH:quinone reductase-like Zn-dependent oxidoreductase
MIIRLGRHDGFKTLGVVRRSEAKDELLRLGADAVVSSSDGPIEDQVRRITGDDGPRFALDPIGGEAGAAVFRSLGDGGRMVMYGTLSGDPVPIDPRQVISKRKSIQGFWLGHWMRGRSIPGALLLFREIANLIRGGVLHSEIGGRHPLGEIRRAAGEAEAVGRPGKVLVTFGADSR